MSEHVSDQPLGNACFLCGVDGDDLRRQLAAYRFLEDPGVPAWNVGVGWEGGPVLYRAHVTFRYDGRAGDAGSEVWLGATGDTPAGALRALAAKVKEWKEQHNVRD